MIGLIEMHVVMRRQDKACPVVTRARGGAIEVLAFAHPLSGRQFVKGTIEPGETPEVAAVRELREESGLVIAEPVFLGISQIGNERQVWHFFHQSLNDLPDGWDWRTEDDEGHVFSFFWHRLGTSLDEDWHQVFHQAYAFFAPLIACTGE